MQKALAQSGLKCTPRFPPCRRAKAHAEEAAPISDDLKDRWEAAELPEDRAALAAYIDERVSNWSGCHEQTIDQGSCCRPASTLKPCPRRLQQMEADAMMIANPAALRQYNDRCKQVRGQAGELPHVLRLVSAHMWHL